MIHNKTNHKGLLINIWKLTSILKKNPYVFSAEILFGDCRLNHAPFAISEHDTPEEAEQEAKEFIDNLHHTLAAPYDQEA